MDERTEHLISRRLDGEITGEESLELDRLLIRSPEARTWMEACERQDRLAAETLHAALPGDVQTDRGESAASLTHPSNTERIPRFVAGRWSGLRAASIALAVLAGTGVGYFTSQRWAPPTSGRAGLDASTEEVSPGVDHGAVAERDDETSPTSPQLVRDVYGVVDEETGNLYLLEATRLWPASYEEVRDY
jgi:anti-sigma factor RsiW